MDDIKLKLLHLLEKPLKYFWEKDFDNSAREAEIMAPIPKEEEVEKKRREIRVQTASPEMQAFYEEPLLEKEQEDHLFRQFNLLKYKAYKLLNKNIKNTKEQDVFLVETLLRQAAEIKKQLIYSNSRLVINLAKKQREYWQNKANLLDLISDGNLGLVKAVDYFDYKHGAKFCTYAYYVILDAIIKAKKDKLKHSVCLTDMETALLNEKDYRASESLDLDINFRGILKTLSEREKHIIEMYYGFNTDKCWTLEEIGREFNISKERVRQLKEQGLEKIRKQIPSNLTENSSC
jgi:RNA polymerase primary sigma factor